MNGARTPLDKAVAWLLERQSPEGWWSGELETNVTMTAEQVLLYRFLGIPVEGIAERAAAHLFDHQRSDGSWALYYDGPADLSTTIEAYVALKVMGVDRSRPEMTKALAVILRLGGVTNARVFTKIWLALFGKYPWDGVPSLPPELVYFPLWMPFNLYDFACWARGTVAPLTIVVSKRPVRELGIDIGEIVVPGTEPELHKVRGSGWMMVVEKLRAASVAAVSGASAASRRTLDRRTSRSRRQLGRHSAAVGVLADRSGDYGLSTRQRIDAPRFSRLRTFCHRRRARLALSSLHVAGVGHGLGGARFGVGRTR
jgi:squalene-hopene/tetraprenyl-beta-curcumene cyclase